MLHFHIDHTQGIP